MKVKICGITSAKDAILCLVSGAHSIGVIVDVPVESPRKITAEKALHIKASIAGFGREFIAVTMPKTVDEAVDICRRLEPDGIQLHGFESPEFLSELRDNVDCQIIKAIHIDGCTDMGYVESVAEYADILLLDTKVGANVGGTGRTHDRESDLEIKARTGKRIMLSGGLNPGNVMAAAKLVRPYAVDVSSGVESSPGVKDSRKVKELIEVTRCL
ncbi:MAG: phosphoribosylanthranilate isomerase [Candidatus Altiarchaeota archaeon]